MDNNRKRPRLCSSSSSNSGVPISKSSISEHTLTTNIGSDSIFNTDAIVGANVFLTLCDSDESQEYLTIDSNTLAAHIKQEQHQQQQQQQQQQHQQQALHDIQSTTSSSSLPLQSYRIVNQMSTSSASSSPTACLPATVQLPSGCEIYLVREYIEPSTNNEPTQATAISTSRDVATSTLTAAELIQPIATTIKMEPDSCLASNTSAHSSGSSVQILRNNMNVPCLITPKLEVATSNISTGLTTAGSVAMNLAAAAAEVGNENSKRSFILEAYKKRDDKRRATHNEVERRRRDKINSWIFKLKEMLPHEMPGNNATTASYKTTLTNATSNEQQHNNANNNSNINANNNNNNNTSRTPPSDSKSQILIKACEYIKAMQDEIKSLRECLTENEELRLSNQRLQNELNTLKSVERSNNTIHNNNNIISSHSNFVTLNTLNSHNGNLFASNSTGRLATTSLATIVASSSSTTAPNAVKINATPYAKRELIIRDYVD